MSAADLCVLDHVEKFNPPTHVAPFTLATKTLELEEVLLADLVARHKPKHEQAFRLARRAEWRAAEAIWASTNRGIPNDQFTTAEYFENLREARTFAITSANDMGSTGFECAEEYIDLIRKIAA